MKMAVYQPELKPAELKLVAKLALRAPTVSEGRTNPFSGARWVLAPLGCALYDWIVSPERGDNIAAGKERRGDWDRARYLFLRLWPDAYYDLLD